MTRAGGGVSPFHLCTCSPCHLFTFAPFHRRRFSPLLAPSGARRRKLQIPCTAHNAALHSKPEGRRAVVWASQRVLGLLRPWRGKKPRSSPTLRAGLRPVAASRFWCGPARVEPTAGGLGVPLDDTRLAHSHRSRFVVRLVRRLVVDHAGRRSADGA